jgi:hypothetical protein
MRGFGHLAVGGRKLIRFLGGTSQRGHEVLAMADHVFVQRSGPGWQLLISGGHGVMAISVLVELLGLGGVMSRQLEVILFGNGVVE